MAEIKLTKDNFDTEINGDMPVLADFWAEWCGPCRMLGPVVAEIAEEYAGKIKVGKVNVDEEPELAMRYQVNAIPTVIVFEKGKVKNMSVGFVPKSALEDLLK